MRKEVMQFANMMEAKLRKNDWKSDWKLENRMYLFERLKQEVVELEGAFGSKSTIEECVDVANFAMMIAVSTKKYLEETP